MGVVPAGAQGEDQLTVLQACLGRGHLEQVLRSTSNTTTGTARTGALGLEASDPPSS